jgi:hypothetical protein
VRVGNLSFVDVDIEKIFKTIPQLTPEGEAARADLERRMGGFVREMQMRRGSWIDRNPSQILMAAVIGVAMGGRMLPEETQLQLVGKQVEQGAAMQHSANSQSNIWFDWHFFNQFDRYFQSVDSELKAGESWGDGGDGGGGDGGGGDD